MKLITLTFFTYIRSILLYLLLTLPVAVTPRIYFISVIAAFVLGLAAWLVFALFSFAIQLLKPSILTVYILLYAAVAAGVITAYSMLLAYAVNGMHFWNIQMFSLFPAAAIIAGWVSIYVNRQKLEKYFRPVRRYAQLQGFSLRPTTHNLN